MLLNNDKKITCQKLLLICISNGTTALYDSDGYVDAGSFMLLFGSLPQTKSAILNV